MVFDFKKLSQAERMLLCSAIAESVYDDMLGGSFDDSALQDAVICQIFVNRIVFKLNERRNEDAEIH